MYFQQGPPMGDMWSDLRDRLAPQVMLTVAASAGLIPESTILQGSNPIPAVTQTENEKIAAAQAQLAAGQASAARSTSTDVMWLLFYAVAGYGIYRVVKR